MEASAAETLALISASCGEQLPLPAETDENTFAAPWQAQVFAMTVALHDNGIFTWAEWAQTLGRHLASGVPDGSDYYEHWADALQEMLWGKGISTQQDIEERTRAWHEAAARTPHGTPIEL